MSSGSRCAERGIEPTILQTRIVSCRRSGLPERTVTADDAASPRAAGFAAFCSSWSLLKLATGGTAIDGRSGCGGSAGFAVSWTAGDPLGAAELGDERPGCSIGLRVQLALEQCNEVFVMPECFGLASRGGQRLYDQPVGVLAQVVDRDSALAGSERVRRPAASSCSPSHHGAKGEPVISRVHQ